MTIIYQTNTGSSEEYARLLSEKISAPCVSLSESADIPADEEIIFIGWIMAGAIQGFPEAQQKFSNIRCVCAVGMMTTEKAKDEIAKKNNTELPLFILPGNFHLDRLKGMYKMMMSMAMKMIKAKLKEEGGENADKMIAAFDNGIDMVDAEKLNDVIEFLK